jgi:hypothetical protein
MLSCNGFVPRGAGISSTSKAVLVDAAGCCEVCRSEITCVRYFRDDFRRDCEEFGTGAGAQIVMMLMFRQCARSGSLGRSFTV